MGSSLGSSSFQSINNDLFLSTAVPGELTKLGDLNDNSSISSAGSESSAGSQDEDEKVNEVD